MITRSYKSINYKRRKKFKKKKPLLKNKIFRRVILFIVLIFLVCYFVFFTGFFKIRKFEVSFYPTENLFLKQRQIYLEKEIGNILIAEFGKNILFFNQKTLEKEVSKTFSEIKKIKIKKGISGKISVVIGQRDYVGTFCFNNEECFLFDSSGIIFYGLTGISQKIKQLFSENLLISVDREIDKNYGDSVLSEQAISQFLGIKKQIENSLKIKTSQFSLIDSKRLNIKTAESWEIYLDLASDIDLSLTKLKILLEKEISSEKRKNLRYIDLRFSKVYYK